jgi:hypothetical protein
VVRRSGDLEVYSPEEVAALARAAASPQDGAMYVVAAYTGLRLGELLALRWRDIDFRGTRPGGLCPAFARKPSQIPHAIHGPLPREDPRQTMLKGAQQLADSRHEGRSCATGGGCTEA